MQSFSSRLVHVPLLQTSLPFKKKYNKVNEPLRAQFIQLIVQDNLSIKQASVALNINYSSAKAILSHHRKALIHSNKNTTKNSKRAQFRLISTQQTSSNPIEEFVCSTGGNEVRRFSSHKGRNFSTMPIVLQEGGKNTEFLDNTSNSHID